jgi:hypothetical protein
MTAHVENLHPLISKFKTLLTPSRDSCIYYALTGPIRPMSLIQVPQCLSKPLAGISLIAVVVLCQIASAQTSSIQELQNLVQKWASLERQSTALLTGWQQQELLVRQRQRLLEEEKSQLQEILDSNVQDTSGVEQRRLELLALQNTMESDQADLSRALQRASSTILSLHERLPPPLYSAWQEGMTLLELAVAADPDQATNLRLQSITSMLNQLEDFQLRISVHESPINHEGREILVRQIYLGASHGWYVSDDSSVAGYGHADAIGWDWLNDVEVDATTVKNALSMLENNNNIELVTLPVRLTTLPNNNSKNRDTSQQLRDE